MMDRPLLLNYVWYDFQSADRSKWALEVRRGEANKYMYLERRVCVCFDCRDKIPKPAQV